MNGSSVFRQQIISDIADWDSSAFGSAIDIVQLTPGRFSSTQQIVDLGCLQVLRMSVNQAVAARGRGATSRYAAVMFDDSHEGDFAHVRIQRDRLVVLPPDLDFDACVKQQGFRCTATFISSQYVEDYYRTLTGQTLCLPAENKTGLIADDAIAARVQLCVDALLDAASNNDECVQHAEYRAAIIDELTTLMLRPLQSLAISEDEKPQPQIAKAHRLVNQLEDYIIGNPGITVRLIDLCEHASVSERTLQYAFQRVLGLSPMQYLTRCRLHQVHAALNQATAQTTTVSAEACRWGFWHLGEFAQAYRTQFGELPSETLQASK
ncbi:transcriptional regulator EutR [Rosistilla ulvae]|uniref:Transcriptional regulator EutR n=1 Tax=Rosistilla ulvae TaxID=1930277 RepID=A0A517LZY9_9BACT|nr:helix-turn-helix domain-containing protein [Rosistilla ulvae]QDS88185.1 transcriptional regulator EutR [Rosistilla ulvae]